VEVPVGKQGHARQQEAEAGGKQQEGFTEPLPVCLLMLFLCWGRGWLGWLINLIKRSGVSRHTALDRSITHLHTQPTNAPPQGTGRRGRKGG
jgi:hypothetical protein